MEAWLTQVPEHKRKTAGEIGAMIGEDRGF